MKNKSIIVTILTTLTLLTACGSSGGTEASASVSDMAKGVTECGVSFNELAQVPDRRLLLYMVYLKMTIPKHRLILLVRVAMPMKSLYLRHLLAIRSLLYKMLLINVLKAVRKISMATSLNSMTFYAIAKS